MTDKEAAKTDSEAVKFMRRYGALWRITNHKPPEYICRHGAIQWGLDGVIEMARPDPMFGANK
jgi:hypothetical protein